MHKPCLGSYALSKQAGILPSSLSGGRLFGLVFNNEINSKTDGRTTPKQELPNLRPVARGAEIHHPLKVTTPSVGCGIVVGCPIFSDKQLSLTATLVKQSLK